MGRAKKKRNHQMIYSRIQSIKFLIKKTKANECRKISKIKSNKTKRSEIYKLKKAMVFGKI